jgi:hypothetical protein
MLTWQTTLRLVRDKAVSPLLVGLVLEEIDLEIKRLKQRRARGNGQSLTQNEEWALRSHLVQRYMLYKKLQEMIDGTEVNTRR